VSEINRFKRFCAEILELRLEPFQLRIGQRWAAWCGSFRVKAQAIARPVPPPLTRLN
jgi:hypothetical protein